MKLHPDRDWNQSLAKPDQARVEEAFKFVSVAWDVSPENRRFKGDVALAHFNRETIPSMRAYAAKELAPDLAGEQAAAAKTQQEAADRAAFQQAQAEARAAKVAEAARRRQARSEQAELASLTESLGSLKTTFDTKLNAHAAQLKRLTPKIEALVAKADELYAEIPTPTLRPRLHTQRDALAQLADFKKQVSAAKKPYDQFVALQSELAALDAQLSRIADAISDDVQRTQRDASRDSARFKQLGGDARTIDSVDTQLREIDSAGADFVSKLNRDDVRIARGHAAYGISQLGALFVVPSGERSTRAEAQLQRATDELTSNWGITRAEIKRSEWAGRVQLIEPKVAEVLNEQKQALWNAIGDSVPRGPSMAGALAARLNSVASITRARLKPLNDEVRGSLSAPLQRELSNHLADLERLISSQTVETNRNGRHTGAKLPDAHSAQRVSGLNDAKLEKRWNHHFDIQY